MSDYDQFASIYDIWCETAAITKEHAPFYAARYVGCEEEGPVVELGVGNGRIIIEAARRGRAMVGVDSSKAMLALCRSRAEAAGVADAVTLVEGDFRDFVLDAPAALIAIPFHTLLHLITLDDKRAGLRHIRSQLREGGQLVFDCFVFDPELARKNAAPQLRAEYQDEQGRDALLWTISKIDESAQTMRLVVWTDTLSDDGVVVERRYRRLDFSWIDPAQVRALLEESGYVVEACLGDFDGSPFEAGVSVKHIWVARRA
ncbi:MAG: class I SAM-dependent methyltransferase [Myxococcales bacterium]|nr:class I SAM-dependent methyltransferase [Myxococcales bacterium]